MWTKGFDFSERFWGLLTHPAGPQQQAAEKTGKGGTIRPHMHKNMLASFQNYLYISFFLTNTHHQHVFRYIRLCFKPIKGPQHSCMLFLITANKFNHLFLHKKKATDHLKKNGRLSSLQVTSGDFFPGNRANVESCCPLLVMYGNANPLAFCVMYLFLLRGQIWTF